jgi:hypothetical protein
VTREALQAELEEQRLELVPLTAAADPWTLEGVCVRLQARA